MEVSLVLDGLMQHPNLVLRALTFDLREVLPNPLLLYYCISEALLELSF